MFWAYLKFNRGKCKEISPFEINYRLNQFLIAIFTVETISVHELRSINWQLRHYDKRGF